MSNVRALKDPYYRKRQGMDSDDHPAGPADLKDDQLERIQGGWAWVAVGVSMKVCKDVYRAGVTAYQAYRAYRSRR
ncbi:hypothetical protein [Pendulispora albinea]|uniref:Uncharacterized protein n=1 Tax=Pendulispora albinea TaxID=2741071 RepID=A0ABZ2LPF2_9BACT